MAIYVLQYIDGASSPTVGHVEASSDDEAMIKAHAYIRSAEARLWELLTGDGANAPKMFRLAVLAQEDPHRIVFPFDRSGDPF